MVRLGENKAMKVKGRCFQRMDDNEDIDNQDWTDLMNLQDYKKLLKVIGV